LTVPAYAFGPATLPAPVVTKTNGGNLTVAVAGTYYFRLQAQNRVGRNLLSASASITVVAGDRINVQIPSTARTDCSDWHYFIVAMSTSADATTFEQAAFYAGYEEDQVTPTPLPATIYFEEDDHLRPGLIVVDIDDLPTGDRLLPGMVRGCAETTFFYTYYPDSAALLTPETNIVLQAFPSGRWIRSGPPDTYVEDITDPGGCYRDIRNLGNTPVIEPVYEVSGSARVSGTPVKLWRLNDTDQPIPAGTRVGLVFQYNEENKSQAFNGLMKLEFQGYANPVTGAMDELNTFGGLMNGIGQTVEFEARKTGLILEKDLPPGQAYAIEVYPEFAAFEVDDSVAIGADIRVYIFFYANAGEYSEAGAVLGKDWIYPDQDRRRVVPGTGLSVDLLSGGYMVESYSVLSLGRTSVFGLAQNTSGQRICINGLGASWREIAPQIPESAALRALVSTQNGRGSAGLFSAYASIPSGSQLQAQIPYPSTASGVGTIRADYPDRIAGNTNGRFNPSGVTLYVQQQSSGEIREFTGAAVVAGVNQTVIIPEWGDGVILGVIPTAAADFGLFTPGQPTVSALAGGGVFPAGSYRVCAAFDYVDRVTKISHNELDGCIFEPDTSLVEVFDRIRYLGQGVNNLAALRQVPPSNIWDLQMRAVRSRGKFFIYNAQSMGVDDGTENSRYVRLSGTLAGQPGRFVEYNELFRIGESRLGVEGQEPEVWITSDPDGPLLNFTIPEGRRGVPGPSTNIRIGSVRVAEFEEYAEARLSGIPPNLVLDLVLPKGDRGTAGPRGPQGPKGDTGNAMDPIDFLRMISLFG
jgi:hypothetical protein